MEFSQRGTIFTSISLAEYSFSFYNASTVSDFIASIDKRTGEERIEKDSEG
jgi:hypothetical protein